jgi:hypothetical protein
MITQAHCETSLNALFPESLDGASGPLPPREGVRFVRGSLCGVTLCLPFWLWILWAVVRHL